jgi:hypothetical protein
MNQNLEFPNKKTSPRIPTDTQLWARILEYKTAHRITITMENWKCNTLKK